MFNEIVQTVSAVAQEIVEEAYGAFVAMPHGERAGKEWLAQGGDSNVSYETVESIGLSLGYSSGSQVAHFTQGFDEARGRG